MIALSLVLFHGVVMKIAGVHAQHSESNLQSNLLRLHRYLNASNPSQGVLVGSSISGRLYAEYFRDEGVEVANLGLDGSRPIYSLDLLLKRGANPKFILIEANTIFWDYTGNDAAITKELNSPTFQLGRWIQPMSPDARPSSVLYSLLKSLQERSGAGIKAERKKEELSASSPEPETYQRALGLISKFREKGIPVALVIIPSGNRDPQAEYLARLSKESGVPLITLRDHLPEQGDNLRYSDGLHLVQDSAKQVVNGLVKILSQMKLVEEVPLRTSCPQHTPGG